MGVPKPSVHDYADQETLLDGISELTKTYADWETYDGQGTRRLWSLLDKVYELGDQIDRNALVKTALIDEVNRDPNVQASNKWQPNTKGAHELLLVKLLGLKHETKAKKSHWLSAIRAAKKAKVEPQSGSFADFLATVGGIDKARKLHVKSAKPKRTFEELSQWAWDQIDKTATSFQTPLCQGEEVRLPGKVGLVLICGDSAGFDAWPVATIADPKLVRKAIEWLISAENAAVLNYQREYEREWQMEAMALRSIVKKEYAAYKSSPDWSAAKLEFSEFIAKVFDEDEGIREQASQIPDLALRIEFGSGYRSLVRNV